MPRVSLGPFARTLATLSIAGTALSALIFLVSPWVFSGLAREDLPVEVASALLALGASILFFRSLRRSGRIFGWPGLVCVGFLALMLFLIAGEEISWGQRIFGIETPETFDGNIQNETNFHNFATDAFEFSYYFSAFVLLIVVPFVISCRPNLPRLAKLLPSPATAAVALPIAAFDYDHWMVSLAQISSFVTLFVAAAWAVGTPDGASRRLFVTAILVLVWVQAIFLAYGAAFLRIWDVTEYKEMVIAGGFAYYAYELFVRLREADTAENAAPDQRWRAARKPSG
ncbi:hypothetical protein JSE7799_03465 [Jannaschia seosinensis]|uniref:Uncharacterized protein n=1 Tax=Jannaschia seosinensis TaxID=313367 RepID=A0A0M7BDB8_9RHOB|nr:hypothetical protein JSE7799_03465 [Jannaschia seosinensis]